MERSSGLLVIAAHDSNKGQEDSWGCICPHQIEFERSDRNDTVIFRFYWHTGGYYCGNNGQEGMEEVFANYSINSNAHIVVFLYLAAIYRVTPIRSKKYVLKE
ncbi:uncharacterized protein LOC143198083 [Rhynchophorus ferrugineus]|uniref:uncharacterized protein LOC143198083 n=1 Tax=Rhynchophorus ferrugineus TaxID=354439 RepID=UPI003FCC5CBF